MSPHCLPIMAEGLAYSGIWPLAVYTILLTPPPKWNPSTGPRGQCVNPSPLAQWYRKGASIKTVYITGTAPLLLLCCNLHRALSETWWGQVSVVLLSVLFLCPFPQKEVSDSHLLIRIWWQLFSPPIFTPLAWIFHLQPSPFYLIFGKPF